MLQLKYVLSFLCKKGEYMKVYIGSIIVVIIILFGVWLMLSPSFKKVGDTASKIKGNIEEEENGKRNTD